ncbi:hypothetical protein RRG08_001244 [Elysia crispata]|uniref:Uncharacterized protein n=1 Tax=Elysia crispata TaxID=231223 RepID=A0AAE1B9C5_9GAST|nr:hypothetical protein RRG08_001244 [Elysia crispata]
MISKRSVSPDGVPSLANPRTNGHLRTNRIFFCSFPATNCIDESHVCLTDGSIPSQPHRKLLRRGSRARLCLRTLLKAVSSAWRKLSNSSPGIESGDG